jgi:hypothetical protein
MVHIHSIFYGLISDEPSVGGKQTLKYITIRFGTSYYNCLTSTKTISIRGLKSPKTRKLDLLGFGTVRTGSKKSDYGWCLCVGVTVSEAAYIVLCDASSNFDLEVGVCVCVVCPSLAL